MHNHVHAIGVTAKFRNRKLKMSSTSCGSLCELAATRLITYLGRKHSYNFIEKLELSHLLVEPLATVLHARLNYLRNRTRIHQIYDTHGTPYPWHCNLRAFPFPSNPWMAYRVGQLTVRERRATFSSVLCILGTIFLSNFCGLVKIHNSEDFDNQVIEDPSDRAQAHRTLLLQS